MRPGSAVCPPGGVDDLVQAMASGISKGLGDSSPDRRSRTFTSCAGSSSLLARGKRRSRVIRRSCLQFSMKASRPRRNAPQCGTRTGWDSRKAMSTLGFAPVNGELQFQSGQVELSVPISSDSRSTQMLFAPVVALIAASSRGTPSCGSTRAAGAQHRLRAER
jgi:hypothetical protein